MGCSEPGCELRGPAHSRPAPLVCFVWRRRVFRFANHREVARSLTAGDDRKVSTPGCGPYAPRSESNWRNNFSRYGRSCRSQCRPDRETPLSLARGILNPATNCIWIRHGHLQASPPAPLRPVIKRNRWSSGGSLRNTTSWDATISGILDSPRAIGLRDTVDSALTQAEEYFEAPGPVWEPAPLAVAEDYLRRARRGLMTPTAIEAELAAKGFLPLSAIPDPTKFDPDAEVWWTLAMTAAWIIERTPDAVRKAWGKYRREVRQWSVLRNSSSSANRSWRMATDEWRR
jgi:hypothetical protein